MEYRTLGRTGLKVSTLCLGTLSFGRWVNFDTARAIFAAALGAGVNFIDTADRYGKVYDTGDWRDTGEAEEMLGRLCGPHRNQIVLATKVQGRVGPGPNDQGLSRHHIMQGVEQSLRRLRTDHITLYQVHRFDPETPLEETLRALDDLVRQGKVRYIGCSNFSAWQLAKALWASEYLGVTRFEAVQPQYSLLVREIETELLPLCRDQGVGVVVYSPLARGVLSGKYRPGEPPPEGSRLAQGETFIRPLVTERNLRIVEALQPLALERGLTAAQFALTWVLGQPGVTSAIIGATRPDQVTQLAAAAGVHLSQDELARVEALFAGA